MEASLEGGSRLSLANMSSGMGIGNLVDDVLEPLTLVLNNPWRKMQLSGLQMEIEIGDEERVAVMKSAQLSGRLFRPGQTVGAVIELEPRRGQARHFGVELKLPEDLAEGRYKVVIGSDRVFRRQLQRAEPHRFRAFDADDVVRILQERLSIRRDAIYLSMVLPVEGVAIEKQSLPDLPGSRALLLVDGTRRLETVQFGRLLSAKVATGYMVLGQESFEIEVRRD